ncbi:MAG TPA: hypothetical protein VGI78_06710 [Acetobacteraceae bacterium]
MNRPPGMRPLQYILGPGHIVVPATDMRDYAAWMAIEENRRVAFDQVGPGVEVSTVFLGLDHSFCANAEPVVFETMVFDDYKRGPSWRYCTWGQAAAGHQETVDRLRARVVAAIAAAGATL